MRHLVSELRASPHSWPFHEAVNPDEVTDYYDIIKEPMGKLSSMSARRCIVSLTISFLDLNTLEQNVENDVYATMDDFVRDTQKIFDNCRMYNAESTNYARCANQLEKYFRERLKLWTNGGEDWDV